MRQFEFKPNTDRSELDDLGPARIGFGEVKLGKFDLARINPEQRDMAQAYIEAARSEDGSWGVWQDPETGATLEATDVDAALLCGVAGIEYLEGLWWGDEAQVETYDLGFLQHVGVVALGGGRRGHNEFAAQASLPDGSRFTVDYADQGDIIILHATDHKAMVDPLGYEHQFVPVEVSGLQLRHSTQPEFLALMMAYLQRIGADEDYQRELFYEAASSCFQQEERLLSERPYISDLIDMAEQGGWQQDDTTELTSPITRTPGRLEQTGGVSFEVHEERFILKSVLPTWSRDSETTTLTFTPDDISAMARAVCEAALGEVVREIRALVTSRFAISKSELLEVNSNDKALLVELE